MITLAEIIDAWATSQDKQFVIVYGPHRAPPNWSPEEALKFTHSWITCQWCGLHISAITDKRVNSFIDLNPAEPDFFDRLKRCIRFQHHCVGDAYIR